MFSMMLVQASERAARQEAEADDGQDFVEALQDTGGDAGSLTAPAGGRGPDQPLGLVGVVQFPRLSSTCDRGMQRLGRRSRMLRACGLGSAGSGMTPKFANRLGQRLGSVDDE